MVAWDRNGMEPWDGDFDSGCRYISSYSEWDITLMCGECRENNPSLQFENTGRA